MNYAVFVAKLTQNLLHLAGSGSGALPGLIAERLQPNILSSLSSQCPEGVILVAGTNGKTTTSRLLADILQQSGKKIIYNRSGSNMSRGHISAFLEHTTWKGHVTADIALLEVDEAVLPQAIYATKPRLVILNNLFRDQLDRYGEVDSIAKSWSVAIKKHLPKKSWLLVNGDDPIITHAAQASNHAKTAYFGLFDARLGTKTPSSTVDAYLSPVSRHPLTYTTYYLSHLGEYKDPASSFTRPPLNFAAHDVRLGKLGDPTRFVLKHASSRYELELPLPGLYNTYNGLASASAALILDIPLEHVTQAFFNFKGAFGRFERLTLTSTELVFVLIKNPVGASEAARTIAQDMDSFNLAVIANDNFADGLDVSWYWDASFECLAERSPEITFSGNRAADMAVRFKYAGFIGKTIVETDIATAITNLVHSDAPRTYVLATYTATLAIQKVLTELGLKSSHWKE